MNRDIEAVTARWQSRNAEQRWRWPMFHEFQIGDALPGTMVYDRIRLAIALQQNIHVFRGEIRRLTRRFR